MWGKTIRLWLVMALFGGFCAFVQANTTVVPAADSIVPARDSVRYGPEPLQLAYNDITIYPEAPAQAAPAAIPFAIPEPLRGIQPMRSASHVRIALLLPMRSSSLHQVAEAVRAGFMAAHNTERDSSVSVTLVETGDAASDILAAYDNALASHDVIVGPLTRSAVTALVRRGMAPKPTIPLTHPDDDISAVPPQILVLGLSLEEEARQVAHWAQSTMGAGRALVISTNSAWQRRAAKAFAQEWMSLGGHMKLEEIGLVSGLLDPNHLAALRQRLKDDPPQLLFLALDAAQAQQVREAIGREIPSFGTSQLNPLTAQQGEEMDRLPMMNGVRFVDMPWQLQPDHAAVMVYPRLPAVEGSRRNANTERFYALGIDAYRLAREIGAGQTLFELDGVTGRLRVDFGASESSLQRIVMPATYRDGVVVPLSP